MSRMYDSTHKIKFTSISERYQSARSYRSKISQLHAELIEHVVRNFKNTKKYKQQVVDVLNLMTYVVYSGDTLTFNWKLAVPLESIPEFDLDLVERTLGDAFLTVDSIDWDITPVDDTKLLRDTIQPQEKIESAPITDKVIESKNSVNPIVTSNTTVKKISKSTPKEDLYVQPPMIPKFDYNKPWLRGRDGFDDLVIYTTLPEIPTKQNEISCTTDVNKMTSAELMNLYPYNMVQTRAPIMYQHIDGLDYEEGLGVLLPIGDYTREQLVDNLVKYPHFFRLGREVNGTMYSFYTHIELQGELHGILDIWDMLPDTTKIPRQKEFIKEYVVRKYLLDFTYKKIEYNYPMFGTLDPFLTLFMPADDYVSRGYTDIVSIAKQCVVSRVNYKQSRNPIVRRLNDGKLYI